MAVVQISRIQVRRGRANEGTGIPQLAGGEFGWAVDTQELFIGNGAVSEGAPYVGNTKILTEHDNFFDLLETYSYRPGEIETGVAGRNTLRTLQDRLDDRLSIRSFGAYGDASDASDAIQKALFELYLRQATEANPQSRVILHFEAGVYNITKTIYLPPYTTIVGAGIDKTVFTKSGNFTMFETVSGESLYTGQLDTAIMVREPLITSSDQSRYVAIKGCTMKTTLNEGYLLRLNSCKFGHFEQIKFEGPKTTGGVFDTAVYLHSKTDLVSTNNNKFVDCEFTGIGFGVSSDSYVHRNEFESCSFQNMTGGLKFAEGQIVGQLPPYSNTITKCTFDDIDRHAIRFDQGTKNASIANRFGRSVGNNGGDASTAEYPIIKFSDLDNISVDDEFSRTYNLSIDQQYIVSEPYVTEVEGPVFTKFGYPLTVDVAQTNSESLLFRLPANVTRSFDIDYIYNTDVNGRIFTRAGVLRVNVNRTNNSVSVSDDYDITGSESLAESLEFSGLLVLIDNVWTCRVNYVNTLDSGNLKFTINSKA